MGGNYEKSMYNQLMDVMARIDVMENSLRNEKREHKEDVDRLNEKIDRLTQENRLLKDDNARLRSIINNDSSNTSLPPSTDQKGGKPANTFNGRKKTGRKAGGQKGHAGTTLTRADIEEKIASGRYRHEIRTIGRVTGQDYVTKYVVDLNVEPVITEIRIYADENGNFCIPAQYRSDVTYGENVKALSVSLYSEGVMSNDRIASFLNAAGNGELGLSEGSVYGFCRKFAGASEESIRHLEDGLLTQDVVATDATTVTVNGEQNYIRNFSAGDTVVYHAMDSKSIEALEGLDFLNRYSGILVHDHETALYHFGTDHAECNVHIIRYLRKNTEETGNQWSNEMILLLCGMNKYRKELAAQGLDAMPAGRITDYEGKYFSILKQGREENKTTSHKYAGKEEAALLGRMEKYSRKR